MLRPWALAAHMYCYADHAAITSARCTGVGWGGVAHDNVMHACVATLCYVHVHLLPTCTATLLEKVATSKPSTESAVKSKSNEVQLCVQLYVATQRHM